MSPSRNTWLAGAALAVVAGCTGPPPLVFDEVLTGTRVEPLAVPRGGAAVLVFITTDCPIANGYAPQLEELIARWRDRPVRFTLVHVDPALTVARARQHAAEFGYLRSGDEGSGCQASIVLDREHRLVRRCGATITPEAVVLGAGGELRYRGRVNNWYGDIGRKRPEPTSHELRDAVEAVLRDRPVKVPRAPAVGCTIEPLGG